MPQPVEVVAFFAGAAVTGTAFYLLAHRVLRVL